MSPHYRRALLAFVLLGFAASVAAAYVHYKMLVDPSYVSLCDVSATVNCQSVYRSPYGSVQGVPISLIGMLWFVLVGLLAWFDTPSPPAERRERVAAPTSATAGYLFVLATAALAVVLYLGYASWFVLKTVCIYCILTYVAVIGIFVVSGAAFKAGFRTLPAQAASDTRRLLQSPLGLSISAFYVALAVAAIMVFPREAVVAASGEPAVAPAELPEIPAAQLAQFEQFLGAQTRVPLAIPTDGADVLIVKFNDYQCPPCRQTYMEYTPIVEKFHKSHPGKVKFVTKDFPLEAECNTGGVHAAACEAAAAVRMARAKNRAEAMEAWLFENQASMSPDLVRTGVRQVGGVADFDAQYARVLEQVRADVALGRQLGVGRTPTFFINGVKIEGGLRPEYFEAAIVYELRRAQAKP
jgi:uncharacterized membrane protein/protein-disulfide isomerase